MSELPSSQSPRHPIGVVTGRTGLSPELLRAWERRYGAVVPGRSPKGRRLYSDLDIERLRLLRRLVDAGRRISDVARLSIVDLRGLESEDLESRLSQAKTAEVVGATRGTAEVTSLIARAMEAVENLDRHALDKVLGEASLSLSRSQLRSDLLVSTLRMIGERWHAGTLRVGHEHMASEVIHAFLFSLHQRRPLAENAPRMIVATPSGSHHELGALLAASIASDEGWDVSYLGAGMPPEEIGAAAKQRGAAAVALSAIFAPESAYLERDLRWLRDMLGEGVALFLGGAEFGKARRVIDEIGAFYFESLTEFSQHLQNSRRNGPP